MIFWMKSGQKFHFSLTVVRFSETTTCLVLICQAQFVPDRVWKLQILSLDTDRGTESRRAAPLQPTMLDLVCFGSILYIFGDMRLFWLTVRQAASRKFAASKRMHDVQLSQSIGVAAMTVVVL